MYIPSIGGGRRSNEIKSILSISGKAIRDPASPRTGLHTHFLESEGSQYNTGTGWHQWGLQDAYQQSSAF
jgi:hypothetical protein